MRQVFKLVFLFVGVVIGAGFATGSEIVLYFKNNGYFSVLFAAIIIGLLSVAFCYFGKFRNNAKWLNILLKIVVFFGSIVTYCVMISGVSELIFTQFGVKYFGIVVGLIVAFLMLYDIKIIKLLNLIIVPLIVILMIVLLAKSGGEIYRGLDLFAAFKYAGMNMLLGGYFLSEEGEQLSHKQIAYVGFFVTFIMGLLMSICYVISMQASSSSMPVFEVARRNSLGGLAAIVVFLAIFTTLIGSGKGFVGLLEQLFPCKSLMFVFVFALSVFFDGLDFNLLIDYCYGYIGKIGFVICMLVLCKLLYLACERIAKYIANKHAKNNLSY